MSKKRVEIRFIVALIEETTAFYRLVKLVAMLDRQFYCVIKFKYGINVTRAIHTRTIRFK
jgi:hypothetical protein